MNAQLGLVFHSVMQTEDQLTRDMLASTASFINCVGGVDGKLYAVVKSSLIDLELPTGQQGASRRKSCSLNVASEKTYRNVRCGALNIAVMQ